MAHAVVAEKTGAAVDLKYDIKSVPQVGKPLDIELAFIAGAALQSMQVRFGSMPGLTLSSDIGPALTDVKAGQIFNQQLTVTPTQPGIYYVSVLVATQTQEGALGRSFSIPLMVGNGTGEAAPAKAGAAKVQKDAAGQAIESMPAQEQPSKGNR